jgi:hypothetical protein
MSLQAARAKIGLAHRQLEVAWERARETWDDPVSRALWDHHLGPLEQSIRSASGAIDQMREVLERLRRECGDGPD